MDYLLILSLIESFYLIFMFHVFETSVDFNFLPPGLLARNSVWFQHILGNEKGLRICLFGRVIIFALIAILIARNFITISRTQFRWVLITSFILALMNMNAVAYLMPVWLLELAHGI